MLACWSVGYSKYDDFLLRWRFEIKKIRNFPKDAHLTARNWYARIKKEIVSQGIASFSFGNSWMQGEGHLDKIKKEEKGDLK